MTTTRLPFVGSGRLQEGGALAVRKQDFNAHVQGTGFRQDATTVDMNPVIPLVGGVTVQEALENLHNLIISAGTGFLSIGSIDGYIQGDYNVGTDQTPTLHDTFNAAFADTRLQNGGLILVLAGTYHLQSTVTVPAGISVMGEIAGTTIIGEMEEAPMFIIQKPNQSIDLVSGTIFDTGSNVDCVKFMNMILADNLDGYALFGEPCMTTVPMIQAQVSSNFACENVSFIGRIHTGATPRTKTQSAIGYTGSGTVGTILKMKDCYLDGLKIGISFTPANNASDFLTVEGCKARIYGTEDGAAQGASLNSFIVTSHCNAVISKNYFVGAGSYVNTFVDIISGSGDSTKFVITDNHGGPNSLTSGKIINDATGSAFVSVITGNAWGTVVDSPWYIVVGGGGASSPLGDFNGTYAIDTVLSLANSTSPFEATVIVNPGTYTISDGTMNYANLKFIGNKYGKTYPIINLNLTTGSNDSLGNLPVSLGNKVQSLQFVSVTNKHSLRPGFNPLSASTQSSAHTMEVLDCIFINTALYVLNLSAPPWLDTASRKAMTNIVLKDCYFLQDGTFSDTISCMLPLADQVHVENCIFTGNGYALSIGHNGYTFGNSNAGSASVSVKNSVFDLTGYTISTQNSLEKSYIYIDDAASLTIDNCQVYADNQYGSVSPVSGSLTSSLTQPFGKFVHLKALNMNIDGCIFVGPAQTFVSSSVTYAMATLFIEPVYSARIRNCRFNSGACLLQAGGASLTDSDFRESIVVENCYFRSGYNTLVDYDLALANADFIGYISFDRCNFANGTSAEVPIHTNTADTSRSGVVQLFVGDALVSFTNNIMNVTLSTVTGKTLYGGLMVNAYDNLSSDGDQINPVSIIGNSIFVNNKVTSTNAAVGSACVLARSSSLQIQNNKLYVWNTAAISASFIGSLMIDNPESVSGSDSTAVITGNTFGRKSLLGTSSNLARGYVQISVATSSDNGGLISDNMFDSTTYNGSSTALIEDNSITMSNNISLSNWVITQNKNQSGHQLITWSSGSKGIATGADLNKAILYGGVVTSSSISADSAIPDTLVFNYAHTGSQDQFMWNLCLSEILPPDVTITKIEYSFQASAVPGTTKTVNATLSGSDGDTDDNNTISGTSIVNRTITPSFNYTTKGTDNVYLHIQANINHSSTLTVTLSQVYITYHW